MRATRWVGIALTLAITGLLAVCAPRPTPDNSVGALLRREDPDSVLLEDFQRRFGAEEVIAIQIAGGAPPSLLALSSSVSDALDAQPLVLQTLSIRTTHPDEVAALLDEEVGGFHLLSDLRAGFEGPLNRALGLFAPETPRAVILAFCRRAPPTEIQGLARVLEGFRSQASAAGHDLRMAGNPLLTLELDRESRKIETRSMPLLLMVCITILLGLTRSVRATLALLLPVGLVVFAAEGLLGLAGRTTNLVVAISGPLLAVILLSGTLHVFVAYQDALRTAVEPMQAAWQAARSKASACALAIVTTATGFASLALSDVEPIRDFGLVTAAGLFLGLPSILLVSPAALALARVRTAPAAGERLGRLATALVAGGQRRPTLAIALAIAFILVGAASFFALEPTPHAIDYFPENHPLRRDHRALEAAGQGLFSLEVLIDSPTSFANDREALLALDRFAADIEALPEVRAVIGLPLLLREAGYRATGSDQIPDRLATRSALEATAEQSRLLLSDEGRTARLALLIGTLDADQIDGLRRALQPSFRNHLEQSGATMHITGGYELLLRAQRSLLSTLASSLLMTAALMELVLLLALRSIRTGLAALLPNMLPISINFSLMVALGIPLDIGTSMTGAIALGIAVDDTLHFIASHRRTASVEQTARSTGRALVLSSAIITAGFASLMLSDFIPTRSFGLLCGTAMLTALAADLLVLPALLPKPRHNRARTIGADA